MQAIFLLRAAAHNACQTHGITFLSSSTGLYEEDQFEGNITSINAGFKNIRVYCYPAFDGDT